MLVTGFGPFGEIVDNPSSILAIASGKPHRILTVSYSAVDEFLAHLDPDSFDDLFLMGVAAGRSYVSLERLARNSIDGIPGSDGQTRSKGPIDVEAPERLEGTLWSPQQLAAASGDLVVSNDAGGYLCNYIYFRALQRFPGRRVGFLHVAAFDRVSKDRQLVIIRELLANV